MKINAIEEGIERPKGGYKYPFVALEKGQSVLIEGTEEEINRARKSVYAIQGRTDKEFETKSEGNGVRVWRTK